MRIERTLLASLVALSLALLPMAGAFAVPSDEPMASDVVVASAHDCCDHRSTPAPAATAAMTTDTGKPMSGKCSGCAGDEKAMAAACSALCGSAVAVLPLVVAFGPVSVETIGPSAAPAATGHAFPPDPYPPRPTVLS
jgi:hypothetical protein